MTVDQYQAAQPIISKAADVQAVRRQILKTYQDAEDGDRTREPYICYSILSAESKSDIMVSQRQIFEAIGMVELRRIQDMVEMMVLRALVAKEKELEDQLTKI